MGVTENNSKLSTVTKSLVSCSDPVIQSLHLYVCFILGTSALPNRQHVYYDLCLEIDRLKKCNKSIEKILLTKLLSRIKGPAFLFVRSDGNVHDTQKITAQEFTKVCRGNYQIIVISVN